MSLSVSKLSEQPSFKARLQLSKKVKPQKKTTSCNPDATSNIISAIGWLGLTIGLLASGIYEIASTIKDKQHKEQIEQIKQQKKVSTDSMTFVLDKTV